MLSLIAPETDRWPYSNAFCVAETPDTPDPKVNLGILVLQALFEYWPQTFQNDDEENGHGANGVTGNNSSTAMDDEEDDEDDDCASRDHSHRSPHHQMHSPSKSITVFSCLTCE